MKPATPAGDPEFLRAIQRQVDALSRKSCYHSLELTDGTVIPGLISVDALRARVGGFPIPQDLRGRRVLDVGAASGWNSFEMERRGADVVAVDCVEYEELTAVRALRGSRVDYRLLDMDELTPANIGLFDYVLFFGVLYHLRHPLLGLERVCALTKEAAFVESFVIDSREQPGDSCSMEFYEIDQLGGQIDNWFGPTTQCLEAMCRSAGFARVELHYSHDRRAGLTCYRKWEAPGAAQVTAPWLYSAVNNRTNDNYFHPLKDEYICVYFRRGEGVTRESLRVEVDGFGVPVLTVADLGAGDWQANLRVPPYLSVGRHEVRLRLVNSAYSKPFAIHMLEGSGRPVSVQRPFAAVQSGPVPELLLAQNSFDKSDTFRGYKAEVLCCRFRWPAELEKEDVLLEVDGRPQEILLLTHFDEGAWQTNSRLDRDLAAGEHQVRVRTAGSTYSNVKAFRFAPE